MSHLQQKGLPEIMAKLPLLSQILDGQGIPVDADLLVTVAGFEDRATAIGSAVEGRLIRDHLTITYPTNASDNENARRLLSAINCQGDRVEIAYDRTELRKRLLELLKNVSCRGVEDVVVDVSGMSSYLFFRLLPVCIELLPNARLHLFYAEAQQYDPSEDTWRVFLEDVPDPNDSHAIARYYEKNEQAFQSRGVQIVYESELFHGFNPDALPVQIVAIPNFSLTRMKAMLAHCDRQFNAVADESLWILGDPPERGTNGWRTGALQKLYVAPPNRSISVSTLNYQDILTKLEVEWEDAALERQLVIATLGSKMQHVGVLLFLMLHPDVGLVLSEPTEFVADRFSHGVGNRWWLPFGKIENLKALLSTWGEVVFHW